MHFSIFLHLSGLLLKKQSCIAYSKVGINPLQNGHLNPSKVSSTRLRQVSAYSFFSLKPALWQSLRYSNSLSLFSCLHSFTFFFLLFLSLSSFLLLPLFSLSLTLPPSFLCFPCSSPLLHSSAHFLPTLIYEFAYVSVKVICYFPFGNSRLALAQPI